MKSTVSKLLAAFVAVSLMAGCAGNSRIDLDVTSKPVKIQHPDLPRQIVTRDVNWHVLTRERLEEMLKDPNYDNHGLVFYALDAKGYENLTLNVADIKRYMEQQRSIIIYYRRLTRDLEKKLNNPEERQKFLDSLS